MALPEGGSTMPFYEGTITLVSDRLTTLIGKLLADDPENPPEGIPLPRGIAKIRTSMPLGPGRTVAVNSGAFSVNLPDLPAPFRYRLLIEQTNGASSVPVYRSLDLPAAPTGPLRIFIRMLD